jgi:hypothetical protein
MGLHSGVRQKGKNWDRVTRKVDERAPTTVGGWAWRVQNEFLSFSLFFNRLQRACTLLVLARRSVNK